MRRHTTMLGLAAATSLLMLTACGSSATDPGAQPAPSASSTGTTATPTAESPGAEPTADAKAPTSPSDTGQQFAENKGAWDLVMRDVRVSRHDGFDRVVVEFTGTGSPGWGVEYVKTPRAEGSGELVDVHGDSFLGVSISGVVLRKGYPRTPEDFLHGPRHFAPEDGGDIEDVNIVGVSEGYSSLFLGIDGDTKPYRVFALTKPSRLVLDVQNA